MLAYIPYMDPMGNGWILEDDVSWAYHSGRFECGRVNKLLASCLCYVVLRTTWTHIVPLPRRTGSPRIFCLQAKPMPALWTLNFIHVMVMWRESSEKKLHCYCGVFKISSPKVFQDLTTNELKSVSPSEGESITLWISMSWLTDAGEWFRTAVIFHQIWYRGINCFFFFLDL